MATDEDFRQFFNADPPPIWLGLAYEDEGQLVAFGSVLWMEWGQAVGFYHCKRAISKFTMQRVAKNVIRTLKSVGEPALYAVPDKNVVGSQHWLRRLGFSRTGFVPPGYDDEVWKLDLR